MYWSQKVRLVKLSQFLFACKEQPGSAVWDLSSGPGDQNNFGPPYQRRGST